MAEAFKRNILPLRARLLRLNDEAANIDFRITNATRAKEIEQKIKLLKIKYDATFSALNKINLEWIHWMGGLQEGQRANEMIEYDLASSGGNEGFLNVMDLCRDFIGTLDENAIIV